MRRARHPATVAVVAGLILLLSSTGAGAFVVSPSASARSSVRPATSTRERANGGIVAAIRATTTANDDDDDDGGADDEAETEARPPSSDSSTARRSAAPTRREALLRAASLSALATSAALSRSLQSASAVDLPNFLLPPDKRIDGDAVSYKQAKRATAYLVDSTIPPSLVPFKASREAAVLKSLGRGSGTPKIAYLQEQINLNNIMNKGVFGAAKFVGDVARGGPEDPRSGKGYASFVFLGVAADYNSMDDASLAQGILTDVVKPRRGDPTALGLAYAPRSTQGALDRYSRNEQSEEDLTKELEEAAAPGERGAASTFLPLLRFAKSRGLSLLALGPEAEDVRTVRTRGLQSVDVDRRSRYVADSEGFINLTQDPKFKLYTEKSLLRNFVPADDESDKGKDSPGDYFAERILVHEAIATGVAQWAIERPDALVAVVAPLKDLRYMGGPNGRVPRICRYLDPDSIVDEECVTTILLNPTAENTLSASKFLRLEIGTGPQTLKYQTKVADYLWFSRMPKVNMIPRMMNWA